MDQGNNIKDCDILHQAAENARMYANSRFSNLSAFLTYVSFLVAAIAVLHSTDKGVLYLKTIGIPICILGTIVAFFFLALEHSHHYWWAYYESKVKLFDIEGKLYPNDVDLHVNRKFTGKRLCGVSATYATYGIYVITMVFFIAAMVFTWNR